MYIQMEETARTISRTLSDKLVRVLRYIEPDVIWTFPSVLSSLANCDVSGINPRLVITQGGAITEYLRTLIEKTLSTEVFETYGSVEFSHMAFECSEHCGLL
jgi:phenylacetate-coenzyme A ligase PaaK-like adenylate-forming protein